MKIDTIASYLAALPETSEEQPFGPDVDVYKVVGKMFAIVSPSDSPPSISLKCDPLLAIELRSEYEAVIPGYHLNKTHWNTVILDGTIPDSELIGMIDHSYERVVAGLTKAVRQRLSTTGWPKS